MSRIRAARCRSRVCIVPAADSGRNLPALSCRTEFLRAGGRKEVVLLQQRPVVFCHNMIAHRLKTVRHAGQILVVDKGQIVQRGTHEALGAGRHLPPLHHRPRTGRGLEAVKTRSDPHRFLLPAYADRGDFLCV